MRKLSFALLSVLVSTGSYSQVLTTNFSKPKENPILKADSSFTFFAR